MKEVSIEQIEKLMTELGFDGLVMVGFTNHGEVMSITHKATENQLAVASVSIQSMALDACKNRRFEHYNFEGQEKEG